MQHSKAVSAIHCGQVYCKVVHLSISAKTNGVAVEPLICFLSGCALVELLTARILIFWPDFSLLLSLWKGIRDGPTAPVKRGPSQAARCASTGDQQAAAILLGYLYLPPVAQQGGLVDPRLRASNEHIPIVRVPRAGGRPGHPAPPLTALSTGSYNPFTFFPPTR